MRIAALGGTGRTGVHLVTELVSRGHDLTVLVRDRQKAALLPGGVAVVVGDSRDADALAGLVADVDAVASTLGPVGKDTTLLRDTAGLLVTAMQQAGVDRYVGISVAGLVLPGDRRNGRDRVISWLLNRLGGEIAKDRIAEYQTWAASPLNWTLVRVPRLVDGVPAPVEYDQHRSGTRTSLARESLARFMADAVEDGRFPRAAPFLTNA